MRKIIFFPVVYTYREEIFDLYISPTGSDALGDGSYGNPYATYAKALAMAVAGQSIGCFGGIYRFTTVINDTKGLTVKNVAGHVPIFAFAAVYLAASWAPTGGTANVYETAYAPTKCNGVWSGTTALTKQTSVALCDATLNSSYFDDPGNKLYINVGGVPGNIDVLSLDGFLVTSKIGTLWDGIIFRYTSYGFTAGAGAYWRMRNCAVDYHSKINPSPFTIYNTNHTFDFKNCILIGNGTSGAGKGVNTSGTATECVVDGLAISGYWSGVYYGSGIGNIVRNSTIHDIGQCGLEAKSATAAFYDNTLYDCAYIGISSSGMGILTAYRNTVYRTAAGTAPYGFVVDPTGIANYYHNVVYNLNDNAIGFLVQVDGIVNVENNIVHSCRIGYDINPANHPGGTRDYNCAYNNSVGNYSNWTPGAHDIAVDPLLTNPAAFDFTLQAGSPCIDAGIAIAGINDDYLGAAPDMGRFEKA